MTKTREGHVKIGFSIWPNGRHASSWRLPDAKPGREFVPSLYAETARLAEKGTFDYYFIGNQLASHVEDPFGVNGYHKPDTFAITSYLAGITEKIGLVATLNTSYQDPFNTARQAATLDHLSKGRAALNIVLGRDPAAALNFSREYHPDNAERYDRGEEFLRVLTALQDSWEDGWYVGDKEAGTFVDLEKAHYVDFHGEHFHVRGPLNIPRPPQGHVGIVHAGQSERSYEFGAKWADVRFIPFESNQAEYYAQNKARLAKYGRRPEDYYLLPGITFYPFETSAEAHRVFREVQEQAQTPFNAELLSFALGTDVSKVSPDDRVLDVVDLSAIPDSAFLDDGLQGDTPRLFTGGKETTSSIAAHNAARSENTAWIVRTAIDGYGSDDITFGDLARYWSNGPIHQVPVVGSPVEVADWIEQQWADYRLDGVVVFPPYVTAPLENFVDLVVPELRRRGIFRTDYTTSTFREHFNLPKPPNVFDRETVPA